MSRKKRAAKIVKRNASHGKADESTHKNKPIHIPLDFEKAVIGLMKVKPKKDQDAT
jgi:hypothetical protein